MLQDGFVDELVSFYSTRQTSEYSFNVDLNLSASENTLQTTLNCPPHASNMTIIRQTFLNLSQTQPEFAPNFSKIIENIDKLTEMLNKKPLKHCDITLSKVITEKIFSYIRLYIEQDMSNVLKDEQKKTSLSQERCELLRNRLVLERKMSENESRHKLKAMETSIELQSELQSKSYQGYQGYQGY